MNLLCSNCNIFVHSNNDKNNVFSEIKMTLINNELNKGDTVFIIKFQYRKSLYLCLILSKISIFVYLSLEAYFLKSEELFFCN